MWYLVLFCEENSVAVVPRSWYIDKLSECFWPGTQIKTETFNKYVRYKYQPEEHWQQYRVELLGKYDDYHNALKKLTKAKQGDTLSTDQELSQKKRKRIPPKKYTCPDSDESADCESDGDVVFPAVPTISKSVVPECSGIPNSMPTPVSNKILTQKRTPTLSLRPPRSISLSPTSSRGRSYDSMQVIDILNTMKEEQNRFYKEVLRSLNVINVKVNDIENKIKQPIPQNETVQNNEAMNGWISEWMNKIPLKSEEELIELEECLLDDANKKNLALQLSRIGGQDVGETVKRIMFKLLTNETGSLFSWDGAKGKKKFKNLKLSAVIIDGVRGNANSKSATEADVIVVIKKWLVRCKDRIKSATTRDQAKENVPQN